MKISNFYYSNAKYVFMLSYYEPKFIENSFGKVAFQILAKIEMTWNQNRLFIYFFETLQHF